MVNNEEQIGAFICLGEILRDRDRGMKCQWVCYIPMYRAYGDIRLQAKAEAGWGWGWGHGDVLMEG